jgi:hypothetical protein
MARKPGTGLFTGFVDFFLIHKEQILWIFQPEESAAISGIFIPTP